MIDDSKAELVEIIKSSNNDPELAATKILLRGYCREKDACQATAKKVLKMFWYNSSATVADLKRIANELGIRPITEEKSKPSTPPSFLPHHRQ